MAIPAELQTFNFTDRERMLIEISQYEKLSDDHIAFLQSLMHYDEQAQAFERHAACGLLARHNQETVAYANYGARFDEPDKQVCSIRDLKCLEKYSINVLT